MDFQTCTLSAPGKALIAGGYLVLEQPNVGVTVACSARFHTTCTLSASSTSPVVTVFDQKPSLSIVVVSAQFHAQYEYLYSWTDKKLARTGSDGNGFIEKCLELTFSFIREYFGEPRFFEIMNSLAERGCLGIKLRADNDFYSQISILREQNLPLVSSSLASLPPFLPCPLGMDGSIIVAKTGMGSSAALTTSLVGALLQFFQAIRIGVDGASSSDKQVVHNLSQLAHAIAQGKLGSGFDVAAAVYGTQVYRRFSVAKLENCMDPNVSARVIYDAVMNKGLWTQEIEALPLPRYLDIMMGDICGGSSSTAMAKSVLRWRTEDTIRAEPLWKELGETNLGISKAMFALVKASNDDQGSYDGFMHEAAKLPSNDWASLADECETKTQLLLLIRLFKRARELLKLMGEFAGVGIEPPEQTALANATEALPGVVCAGVPGAGGNDALFAVHITTDVAVRRDIEAMWAEWSIGPGASFGTVACPLTLTAERSQSGINLNASLGWD